MKLKNVTEASLMKVMIKKILIVTAMISLTTLLVIRAEKQQIQRDYCTLNFVEC